MSTKWYKLLSLIPLIIVFGVGLIAWGENRTQISNNKTDIANNRKEFKDEMEKIRTELKREIRTSSEDTRREIIQLLEAYLRNLRKANNQDVK
jgi:Sec-independent protein translocase protein TatA